MKDFCESSVPDFLSTVNIITAQEDLGDTTSDYYVQMPNFKSTSVYAPLSGICGTIKWKNLLPTWKNVTTGEAQESELTRLYALRANISTDSYTTAVMSRAIAIQQMYADLMPLAQVMVDNDPSFSDAPTSNTDGSKPNYSTAAKQAYGVPRYPGAQGTICQANTSSECTLWAGITSTSPPLLAGTELQNAVQDYNGIMLPTLTLIKQNRNFGEAYSSRMFLQQASTDGWIMAGSYFYDLVKLSGTATSNSDGGLIDDSSGLENTKFDDSVLTAAFPNSNGAGSCDPKVAYKELCYWMNQSVDLINPIVGLITGKGVSGTGGEVFNGAPPLGQKHYVKDTTLSSTVYGYTNNATILRLPNQPGLITPILTPVDFTITLTQQKLYPLWWDCMEACFFMCVCLGGLFGDLLYNMILVPFINMLIAMIIPMLERALNTFLILPLIGLEQIFWGGMQTLAKGSNPIVSLALMGTFYINFAMTLYLQTMVQSIAMALVPVFGPIVLALLTMALPLLMSWLGIMVTIGFTTAYYVPLLPYMMFTFGAIAWFITVIEAMVAAPIVALGVTHPEGHDAFGKGEQAVMILMNVFLRPAMMVIGYIAAIILSFVSVWLINQGFTHAIAFMHDSATFSGKSIYGALPGLPYGATTTSMMQGSENTASGYGANTWSGLYSFFFSVLIYTSMYLAVVTKSFSLIAVLPDKVLRWIGGQAETAGSEAAQMSEEVKKQVDEGGKQTQSGTAAGAKRLSGAATEAIKGGEGGSKKSGGDTDATSGDDKKDDKGSKEEAGGDSKEDKGD